MVSCGFVTFFYVYSADPIPEKSADLYYVRLDAWSPDGPIDPDHPERPPRLLTFRDATALVESEIPTRSVAMFRTGLYVTPEEGAQVPDRQPARFTTREFFAMFDAPFRYGGTWSEEADREGQAVVVLDAETNDRYFGGRDSVGERLLLHQEACTVVGVLERWRPPIRFYDLMSGGARDRPEALYVPLARVREKSYGLSGSISRWQGWEGGHEDFLQSEDTWMQMWVELRSAEERSAFQAFVDAYTEDQRRLGRFQRPTNNWLQPLGDWLAEMQVLPASAKPLMWIGLLFLVVCAVNLIGLLLGKFLTRAPEVGVRRALGASRRSIFAQYLVECELVSLLGGLLGWALLRGALEVANHLPEADLALHLNLTLGGIGLALALLAGVIAGAYPAWQLSKVAPAIHLKVR
jgi:putative ABC transport system permease protein